MYLCMRGYMYLFEWVYARACVCVCMSECIHAPVCEGYMYMCAHVWRLEKASGPVCYYSLPILWGRVSP